MEGLAGIDRLLQQNVVDRHIGEDERHLRLVLGILEDLINHLKHRSDPSAAGDHAYFGVLVGLVRQLEVRAFEVERVADLQGRNVLRHDTVRVRLDGELQVALLVRT